VRHKTNSIIVVPCRLKYHGCVF